MKQSEQEGLHINSDDTGLNGILENSRHVSRIDDIKKSIRRRAISGLLEEVNNDENILQSLPDGLMALGKPAGALWLMEDLGKKGFPYSWNSVEDIISQSFQEREMKIRVQNISAEQNITKALLALFQMATESPLYKDNPELYMLMGNFELERGDVLSAISFYDEVMDLGASDGYIASAQAYEKLGNLEMAISLLEVAWNIHKETNLLEALISVLCNAGKLSIAVKRYHELQGCMGNSIKPFIFYKGTIESDQELFILEESIAQYTTSSCYLPSPALKRLSHSASVYIKNSLNALQYPFRITGEKGIQRNISVIKRGLFLMQFDIFSLKNNRYVELYFSDIMTLGFSESIPDKNLLKEFFLDHFSIEVSHEVLLRRSKILDNHLSEKRNKIGSGNRVDPTFLREDLSLYQSIYTHASTAAKIFFQGKNYPIYEKYLLPIIRESIKRAGNYDDALEASLGVEHGIMRTCHDFSITIHPHIRQSYDEFLRYFDSQYGLFFRKQIEMFFFQPEMNEDVLKDVLLDYPDVGLLYLIEMILCGKIKLMTEEQILERILDYKLHFLEKSHAILFGFLLYNSFPDCAIQFFLESENLIYEPEVLYILTSYYLEATPESFDNGIKNISIFIRENYGVKDFYTFVEGNIGSISSRPHSETDEEFLYLVSANLELLKRRPGLSLSYFQQAGLSGSIEGIIGAGDIFLGEERFPEAIDSFEEAFCLEPNLLTLTKLLQCLLIAGELLTAKKYVQYGLLHRYDISNYIILLNMRLGEIEEALLLLVRLSSEGTLVLEAPMEFGEGVLQMLDSVIDDKISEGEDSLKNKIFASYILSQMTSSDRSSQLKYIRIHWRYIATVTFSKNDILKKIEGLILLFLKPDDLIKVQELSSSDSFALQYLHIYAQNTHKVLIDKYVEAIKNNDSVSQKQYFDEIDQFCKLLVDIFRNLPDSGDYVVAWDSGENILPKRILSRKKDFTLQ